MPAGGQDGLLTSSSFLPFPEGTAHTHTHTHPPGDWGEIGIEEVITENSVSTPRECCLSRSLHTNN